MQKRKAFWIFNRFQRERGQHNISTANRGHSINNTTQPLIGITAGAVIDHLRPTGPWVMGQTHAYVDAVIAAGGVPMVLPMTRDKAVIEALVQKCDGFLLAGGNDIDPVHYGEENLYSKEIDPLRDDCELNLIHGIQAANKPVLAICRGMQLLNITRGGSLHQDINQQTQGMQEHQASTLAHNVALVAHQLTIDTASQLYDIIGAGLAAANSSHHQAINKVGAGLVVTATAEDGIIEAIEDPSREFMIGIQCHPESMWENAEPRWAKLFERLVQASRTAGVQESPLPGVALSVDSKSEIEITNTP